MALRDGQAEIARILTIIEDKVQEIRELNVSDSIEGKFIDQMLISRFYAISTFTNRAAIAIAVAAVKRGDITKRNAADRLHIHPHTVDRYITRFDEDYEAQRTNPLDPEVLNSMD